MKRLTLLFTVLLFGCISLHAQYMKFSFGVQGGGTVLYYTDVPEDITRALPIGYGGYGGAFFELRAGKVLGLNLGADYSYTTSMFSLDDLAINTVQQYIEIPIALQLWMGNAVAFELGIRQSIQMNSSLTDTYNNNSYNKISPDTGAPEYYVSAIAGFKFNMGRVVFLTLRGSYGLSPTYNFYGTGTPNVTAHIGLGFRFYSYRKSAFK